MLVDGEAGIGKSRLLEEFVTHARERRSARPRRLLPAVRRRRSLRALRPDPRPSLGRAGRRRPGPVGRRPCRPLPVLRLGHRPARRRIGGAAAGRARRGSPLGRRVDGRPPVVRGQRRARRCRSSSWPRDGRRRATAPTACRWPSASSCDRDGPCRCTSAHSTPARSANSSPASSAPSRRRGCSTAITGRADGNPFFVEELVAAGGGADLPTTIGDVVLQRVAGVGPTTQQLLRVAAVIGRRVSYSLLRDVGDLDAADGRHSAARGGEQPADGAVRRALLVPPRPRP